VIKTKTKPVKRAAKKPGARKSPAAKPETVLVLRTCASDRSAHGGFVWPESGPVSCSDWDPRPVCGFGLHGLLWGCGNGGLLAVGDADAKWLVVEVIASEIVSLDGGEKVKFPRGVVVFCGDRKGATDYIYSRKPGAVVGVSVDAGPNGSALGGDASTVTGGYASTVTGGYASTVTGGDASTVTGGARAKVTGGARAKVTGGDASTVTGGDASTVTGGARAKVTGGYASTVTGGYASTVTGGDASTVTGGYASTVTGGDASTVTGGDASILCLKHWDGRRWRMLIGYVGEDGIESGKPYRVNKDGKIVPAEAK